MSRLLPLLAMLAACPTTPADDDDDSTDDTDVVDDTEAADDTDEPVGDDTDEVEDPVACAPGRLSAGVQLDGEPDVGQSIVFRRVIDVCADDEELSGTWIVTVTDDDGKRFCGFEVRFAATVVGTACPVCEHEFSGVTFTGATFSDADLCALFGIDDEFVANLATYDDLGIDVDEPDLLHPSGASAWIPVDPSPETVREVDVDADATRLTLTFATGYAY